MKKIIAISVMFALIAGAAFADTSVGGNLRLGASLLVDKGAGDDVLAGNMWLNDANTKVEWSGDNAGGLMKLHSYGSGKGSGDSAPISWTPDMFAFVWWKPIDQLRIQFGKNADGDFGHNQITGWGFNAEAQASVALDHDAAGPHNLNGWTVDVARDTGFWGGFGTLGTAISIYPVQGFEIDICIPMNQKTDASTFYSNTKLNFKYDITDIGTIRFAADLNKANKDADLIPNVYFAFYLSAIENMGIELGVASKASGGKNKDGDPNKNDQVQVGVGYSLNMDDFGLKARLGAIPVMGKEGGETVKGIPLGLQVLPSYNLGALTVYLNAGFGTAFSLPEGAKASAYTDWYFNPYIAVPLNAGKFYAGIKVAKAADFYDSESDSYKSSDSLWSIPIGWNVYF